VKYIFLVLVLLIVGSPLALAQSKQKPSACSVPTDAQNTSKFINGKLSSIASRSVDKTTYCYQLYKGSVFLGTATVWYNDRANHTNGTNVFLNLNTNATGNNSVVVTIGNDSGQFSNGEGYIGHEGYRMKFDFFLKSENRTSIPDSQY
jgi:hypothetical protein